MLEQHLGKLHGKHMRAHTHTHPQTHTPFRKVGNTVN